MFLHTFYFTFLDSRLETALINSYCICMYYTILYYICIYICICRPTLNQLIIIINNNNNNDNNDNNIIRDWLKYRIRNRGFGCRADTSHEFIGGGAENQNFPTIKPSTTTATTTIVGTHAKSMH